MLVELKPKEAFQVDADATKTFRGMVDSALFKNGVHNALAQLVLFHRPTTEELEGVRQFLMVLLNMGEKEDPPQRKPIVQSIASLIQPQPKK